MTLLLELNDLGVRCYQNGKMLWQSAGVAVVDPAIGQPLFGSAAWRESRKKPLHTYTQFWSQLNTEPLQINHPLVRHHGDLAYLHLRHIESQLPFSFAGQEVVFALPGSTPRESLSLLLGIANQCGLKTLSFIDSALASMLARSRTATVTHVEMSLHHCVLTELQLAEHTLHCGRRDVLSDQGWFSLHTQLLNYFSDLFIQQTRFNPRHGAASEQLLFDAIPDWLRQSAALERDGVTAFHCELNQNRVQVDIAPLRQFVQSVWQPLQSKLAQATNLFLGDRLAQCMPLLTLPDHTVALTAQQLMADLAQLTLHLSANPGGVRFISSLPCPQEVSASGLATAPATPRATHMLWQHRVYPLQAHHSLTPQKRLAAGATDHPLLTFREGKIQAYQGQLTLNGTPVGQSMTVNEHALQPGDRLGLTDAEVELTLVRVED